ncbi:MAG: UDP-N-acetylmuramoyl-L-alanine--D-glutamate ligase [Variovorax sp.]|nr:MAG: UDP-N-acetylmuramoyl-L-alanine--D-glutamate ligase [Variovorax sp.]
MKHLHDLHVLILGLGASGLAMARWCARHGAHVTVADTREAPPQRAALHRDAPDAIFVGGAFSAALVEGTPVRAVYRSPGLAPADIAPVVDAARAIGLAVGGELDLFARALQDLRDVDGAAAAPDDAAHGGGPVADAAPDAPDVPDPEALRPTPTPSEPEVEPRTETGPAAAPGSAPADPPGPEVAPGSVPDPAPAAAPGSSEIPGATAPPAAPDAPSSVAASAPARPVTASPHTAAREAAAFVARIAELSVAAPVASADDEAPTAAVVPEAAPAPAGYRPVVLAITGTNGKTTVTSLTGQLVERAGRSVAVAGNIGPTLLDTLAGHLDAGTLPEVWVLELSSFQLDGVRGFEPTAATVLNLSQDHLDWHGDMTAYAAAKAGVFGLHGLMVLNRDDPAVMGMLPAPVRARLQRPRVRAHVTFGTGVPRRFGDYGIEHVNGMAWLVRALEADETLKRRRGAAVEEEEIILQRLMPADALRIRGQHNAQNALAALALAGAAGCALAPMLYGLREYRGEPHRVEPVAIVDEVEYFDDSKGTNVGATVAALGGLGAERRVVAILGGEGKGQDFAPLAAPVERFARAVVLIGRDAPLIERALAATGVALLRAASMDEAVARAAQQARPGDAVLLSPACASFDMFRDYAHRAAVFVAAVEALADASATASSRQGTEENHS